jgi:hypothetical protein
MKVKFVLIPKAKVYHVAKSACNATLCGMGSSKNDKITERPYVLLKLCKTCRQIAKRDYLRSRKVAGLVGIY